MDIDELIGKQFGYLTIVKRIMPDNSKAKHLLFECQCICGKQLVVRYSSLRTGNTKSCGCMKGFMITEKKRQHGQSDSRLYRIYNHIKERCLSESCPSYHRYGGRGITICSEWLGKDGFKHFYDWAINNGYQDDLTIDRINNDGNYEPSNCRWATPQQQMNNMSRNVKITYNNEIHTISEWAQILDIDRSTIQARINKYKMSPEEALFIGSKRKKQIAIYKNNQLIYIFDSQKKAADFLQLSPPELCERLNHNPCFINEYRIERVELASPNQYAERIS